MDLKAVEEHLKAVRRRLLRRTSPTPPPVVVQELPPHKALHNLELATALARAGWRGSGTLAKTPPSKCSKTLLP